MSEIGYQIIIGIQFFVTLALVWHNLQRKPHTLEDIINPRDDDMENITRQLQEGLVSQATATAAFRKEIRENLMEAEDQKTIIVDLRAMIVTKNQNIELKAGQLGLQSGLLIVSAHEIETLHKFNDLQEIRIRELETKLAATLHDDYAEHQHSIKEDKQS